MILFYSDYLEGCHPEILRRLEETNFCQTPGYGLDEYCSNARELIRDLCGKPSADVHFLTGGTQANATVISSVLRPYQCVMSAVSGHINVHETGAVEHGGHHVMGLPCKDGKVSAETVKDAIEEHFCSDSPEHCVQPAMLYISQPTELGTLYTLEELKSLKTVCAEWNIPLFVDGARLGYGLASDGNDVTLEDMAEYSDIFYIGGTKQGALFGEAVVICNDNLKKDFRYNIKQGGGMLAKGRLLGLQFDTLLRPREDCVSVNSLPANLYFGCARKADELALRIRDAFANAGCEFLIDSKTNQQFPVLTERMADALRTEFGFEFWKKINQERTAYRFCTSWNTTDSQVDALVEAVMHYSRNYGER